MISDLHLHTTTKSFFTCVFFRGAEDYPCFWIIKLSTNGVTPYPWTDKILDGRKETNMLIGLKLATQNNNIVKEQKNTGKVINIEYGVLECRKWKSRNFFFECILILKTVSSNLVLNGIILKTVVGNLSWELKSKFN